MQVLTKAGGEVVPGVWCIGDANGKMMLAHAASAQVLERAQEGGKRRLRRQPRLMGTKDDDWALAV